MSISKIKNSFIKHFHYGEINPMRDWLVLITLFIIALAGVVVWDIWSFGVVTNGGTIGGTKTVSTQTLDQSSLNKINIIFSSRAAEENKYKTGVYRYADPSQ